MIVAQDAQGVAIVTLANMIASTVAFRNRRQEYSIEEALQHVFHPNIEDAFEQERPCAVITDEGFKSRILADGTFSQNSGTLGLILLDDDLMYDDHAQSQTDFLNFCGGVKCELERMAATDGLLAIDEITTEVKAGYTSEKNVAVAGGAAKPLWLIKYAVNWANFST
jgi:hypothetical protein